METRRYNIFGTICTRAWSVLIFEASRKCPQSLAGLRSLACLFARDGAGILRSCDVKVRFSALLGRVAVSGPGFTRSFLLCARTRPCPRACLRGQDDIGLLPPGVPILAASRRPPCDTAAYHKVLAEGAANLRAKSMQILDRAVMCMAWPSLRETPWNPNSHVAACGPTRTGTKISIIMMRCARHWRPTRLLRPRSSRHPDPFLAHTPTFYFLPS